SNRRRCPVRVTPGQAAETRHIVRGEELAVHWGGDLPVLASPVLIGLIETACMAATDQRLEAGQITAGFGFALQHLAPTPEGGEVTIAVKVVEASGRKITYAVTAQDSHGIIAQGHHVRAILDRQAFLSKL